MFDITVRPKHLREFFEKPPTDFRVCILPTAEEDGQFDLVPIVQEFGGAFAFGFEIVIIDLRADAHLFKLNNVLVLASFAFLPALLIAEFSVIHEPTDRRNCVWSNFDEIQTTFPCHFERVSRLDNSDLGAQIVNQANFTDANPFVNPCLHWPSYGLPPAFS